MENVKAFAERLRECSNVMDIFLIMPYPEEELDQYQVLEMRAKRAGINVPAAHSCENVARTLKMFQNKGDNTSLEDFKNVLLMMLNAEG